jgi:tetratricopeptide (TPR) repeat protein
VRQISSLYPLLLAVLVTYGCAASRTSPANATAAWQQAYDTGRQAYEHGNYPEAQKMFAAAVQEAEPFGDQDPRLARSLNDLAAAYAAQGKYTAAEPLYKRSLVMLEKAYGPDHPAVATALSNYAQLLQATGRSAEAAQLEARARAIHEKAGR